MLPHLTIIESYSVRWFFRGWKAAFTMIYRRYIVEPATVPALAVTVDRSTSDLNGSEYLLAMPAPQQVEGMLDPASRQLIYGILPGFPRAAARDRRVKPGMTKQL